MRPSRTLDRVARAIAALYVVAAALGYAAWKAALAERSGDPAGFENMLWNASHGRGLQTALEGGVPHLAIHWSPILYALVPLYRVTGSLLAVHALVAAGIAGAGLVLYGRFRASPLGSGALAGMLVFLLHPSIVLQTFMEFHEQALAPLPLVGLLLAHERRAPGRVALASLALVCIREDNALVLFALAALAWIEARDARLCAIEAGVGALGLVLYFGVGVQMLGHGGLPPVFRAEYGGWGSTPGAAVAFLATHPLAAARHLLSRPVLSYLAQLLAPFLGVLPLGSSAWLAGLPALALNLFADAGARQLQVRMHYSIAPAAAFAVAMLRTLERRRFGPALCWVALAATLATVPVWALRARARVNPYRAEIRRLLATIPDTASIAAPNYLLGELARRPIIGFAWRDTLTRLEYILVEDRDRKFYPGATVDTFFTPALGESLRREDYEEVPAPRGWHLFHAGKTPRSPVRDGSSAAE